MLRRATATSTATSTNDRRRICDEAPDEFGLLITLDKNRKCRFEFVPNKSLADKIHPNAHGPTSLHSKGLVKLGGGGSGVTVFSGHDEELGGLVMKHGGHKDTKELFALAEIAQELSIRRRANINNNAVAAAVDDMQSRIPEFKMLYISPRHLWTRPTTDVVWHRITSVHRMLSKLTQTVHSVATTKRVVSFSENMINLAPSAQDKKNAYDTMRSSMTTVTSRPIEDDDEEEDQESGNVYQKEVSFDSEGTLTGTELHETDATAASSTTTDGSNTTTSTTLDKSIRPIRLYANKDIDKVKIVSHHDTVDMFLGNEDKILEDGQTSLWYGVPNDGFDCLKDFCTELIAQQQIKDWKFTMAQKRIGGDTPKSAFEWLAQGLLEGRLLDTLIMEEIRVIRNLQQITTNSEADEAVVNVVRAELENYSSPNFCPSNISDAADAFVGHAIRKNWNPENGRFVRLKRMGTAFRQNKLTLTAEETIPAHYLGMVLEDGVRPNDVFASDGDDVPLLTTFESCVSWRDLLKEAVSLSSPATRKCLWNCGLADGGLHNMFLSQDRMCLFDLGEPTLQPVPAFLTKFLFSFFHTLGMVDDSVKGRGWVNRFVPPTDTTQKLVLTKETEMLIPKAENAFCFTVDKLVEELFDGEDAVRRLLLMYVNLQLLSDAAFCLEKWTKKGGGRPRSKANHNRHIEEWLWRALWDIYIASTLDT